MQNDNLLRKTEVYHSSVIFNLQSCLNIHLSTLPFKHSHPFHKQLHTVRLEGPWLSVRPPHSSYCTVWTGSVKGLTVNNARPVFTSRSNIRTLYAILLNTYFRRRLAAQPAAHPSGRLCWRSNFGCLQERGWRLQRGR
jgi:hypothetical protein